MENITTVNDLLSSFSGESVTLLLNVGNRGDGLIYIGAKTLFKKYNITCKEIKFPEEVSGDLLFVLGCGGFSLPYHHMVKFIQPYLDKFNEIYILPASFDIKNLAVKDFIKQLPEKVKIYCREKYSFSSLKAIAQFKNNILLDHDMAMYVPYENWVKEGRGVLVSFRTDDEVNKSLFAKTRRRIIKILLATFKKADIYDVSRGTQDEGELLLDIISGYKEIHTNRAHVGIAAAMLGKKTYIYPGSYHKQKGIYEFSLSHLPNVRYINL